MAIVTEIAQETELEEATSKYYSMELIGIYDDKDTTTVDEEVHREFCKSLDFVDGRYLVGLPWMKRPANLPTNFRFAFGRLKSIIRMLHKCPVNFKAYTKLLNDQQAAGMIEVIRNAKKAEGPIHYLPHKTVGKADQPMPKMRIVFDASAKARKRSKSLNDYLHRGPLFICDLAGMLLRFRLPQIVVVAVLEKAFLQIEILTQDCDATRF
uniref:Uncharacterized protein n=1 Tax=Ditylenchus dipsaci TaxID=166011 RepID=A0A915D0G2_9BILA